MRSFLQALKYCWPYRGLVVLAWLCAFAVAGLWAGSIGTVVPLFNIFFREPMQGVRYLENDRTLEASRDWKVAVVTPAPEGPKPPPFEVRGDTIFVSPGVRVIPAAEGLEALALEAERDRRSYAPVLRWLADVLPKDRFLCLGSILLGVVVMTVLRGALTFAYEYLIGYATNRALLAIRMRLFDHVLRGSLVSYATLSPSDIISRFTQDSFLMMEGMKTVLGKVISEPFRAMVCVVLAVWFGAKVDPRLPVIVFVTGPLVLILVRQFSKLMRRATRKALESRALILGTLDESLFGIRIVKGYILEGHTRRRFFQRARRLFKQLLRTIRLHAVTTPVVETIFTVAVVIATILGGKLVIEHGLGHGNLDELLLFFGLLVGALDPVRKLANVSNVLQEAASASDRVFALLKIEPEPRHGAKGIALPRIQRSIEFRGVSFSYPTGDEVLHGINLEIRHGETLAVIGRTGCGKTTLVSMIPRFFVPSSGAVLVDGTDLRDVTLRSLREQIAIVPQETMLFADTIGRNIALVARRRGSTHPSQVEIEAAAVAAHADIFIRAIPEGYDALIGEHGTTLSGGERQRLALARAIIRDPAILILDEATSSLDEETQALVQDTLRNFSKGRTTILIAHRLSTLGIADRIVIMDAGRIVDIGTHEELLASCALYQRLRDVGLEGA